jgi:hypothetical protein
VPGGGRGASGAASAALGDGRADSGAASGATGGTTGGALASGAIPEPNKALASPADFAADWREKAAGDDKAFLNVLKRYADPWAALNWVRTQSLKISAGELRPVLKADASAEEVAEYRKANGLPEKAEGYVEKLKLPNGVVTGEADKPLLDSFAATAHANNLPQDAFNAIVGWSYENQNRQAAAQAERDQDTRIEAEQKLISSMGADFKPNMNALSAFWRGQPDGIINTVLGARSPDGRVVGDIPEISTWLAGVARQLNPSSAVLPAGGEQGPKAIESRMREIESKMYVDGQRNPEYFSGPMEKEYRDLIDAQQRTRAA